MVTFETFFDNTVYGLLQTELGLNSLLNSTTCHSNENCYCCSKLLKKKNHFSVISFQGLPGIFLFAHLNIFLVRRSGFTFQEN